MRLLICAAAAVMVACGLPDHARGQGADLLRSRGDVLAATSYTISAARLCGLRPETWFSAIAIRVLATVDAVAEEAPLAQPSGPAGVRSYLDGVIAASEALARSQFTRWGDALCRIIDADPDLLTIDRLVR